MRDESASHSNQMPVNKRLKHGRDVTRAQEIIYSFLLKIVREWSPEDVLAEFRSLFIHQVETTSDATIPALYEIVFANQEQEFRNTLKRSCYILINNWDLTRHYACTQQLIQLFSDPVLEKPTMSPALKRLRIWLKNFIGSDDFRELQLFAARLDNPSDNWSDRYTSYLLVPQFVNQSNPIEQREAARTLARKLREQFKFELALYTACSQSARAAEQYPKNPTYLGDGVLRLIKMIVARRGKFSFSNLAHIFVKQTQNLRYRAFKKSLLKYLIPAQSTNDFYSTLRLKLTEKLMDLYVNRDLQAVDEALFLRTCNRVIEYLTTENEQQPTPLFILLLSKGSPLTLVVVLLKLILISPYSRIHLESRIASLIRYYENCSEQECQWVIHFFEVFRITMTIHAENIEYNLVDMNRLSSKVKTEEVAIAESLNSCRIFSQIKQYSQSVDNDMLLSQLDVVNSAIAPEEVDSPEENILS
jgi:hypothetical protein